MNLASQLQQAGAIDAMARELGVDPATAQKAAGALLPAIVAGLGRNQVGAGDTRNSLGGLGAILGGLTGGGGLLDQVLHTSPTPTGAGNDILGQIFGNKDVSRGVADEVAGATGLGSDLLRRMLPILVTAVIGLMMKQKTASPASGQQGQVETSEGLGGILAQIAGGLLRR